MAIGLLTATGLVAPEQSGRYLFMGELSLDGRVKPVRGQLAVASAARRWPAEWLVVPVANAEEGALADDLPIYPATSLAEVVEVPTGHRSLEPCRVDMPALFRAAAIDEVDFSEVASQQHVKRALEVAAAGGTICSWSARRLSTIPPEPRFVEVQETTKVHSIAGLLPADQTLIARRIFRSPHHTISDAGLIGGGAHPRPGEVS